MSLFNRMANVTHYQLERVLCGEACAVCHSSDPGCTMQAGHSKTHGHKSNSGSDKGCGHSWGKG